MPSKQAKKAAPPPAKKPQTLEDKVEELEKTLLTVNQQLAQSSSQLQALSTQFAQTIAAQPKAQSPAQTQSTQVQVQAAQLQAQASAHAQTSQTQAHFSAAQVQAQPKPPTSLAQSSQAQIAQSPIQPQVQFASSGYILPAPVQPPAVQLQAATDIQTAQALAHQDALTQLAKAQALVASTQLSLKNASSKLDDEDDEYLCEELKKRKGVKEEMQKLFVYERSYMYKATGLGWGLGPDIAQRTAHRKFLSDPLKALHNSPIEDDMRARLATLEDDALFSTCLKQFAADALEQYQLCIDPQYKPKAALAMDFSNPNVKETFAELTAMFLHHDWAKQKCRAQKRPITDTVSLLKENKATLLSLNSGEFKQYRGRSIVSYLLENNSTKTASRTNSSSSSVVLVERKELEEPSVFPKRTREKSLQEDTPPKEKKRWGVLRHAQSILCSNCNGKGHLATQCPSPIPVPADNTKTCFCCQGKGHYSNACTSPKYQKK